MTVKRISTEPPWASREANPDELILRGRTPAELWGFGQHPSTSLCLSILVGLYADGAPRPDRVAEVSCGSGLLCIAAAKLGARRVTGIEAHFALRTVAAENALNNQARLEFVASATDLVGPAIELTIANLTAPELHAQAGLLAKLAAQGHLLIAGFTEEERESVEQEFLSRGFRFLYREVREGFYATVLKSRAADAKATA